MSCPFGSKNVSSRPSWGTVAVKSGNFAPLFGGVSTEEVGFGEGGFGQGGFDAPGMGANGIPIPNWAAVLPLPCTGVNSAIILFDSSGVRWAVTVDTSGHLVTTAEASPLNSYENNPLILIDSAGAKWILTINTNGDLITSPWSTYLGNLTQLLLSDSNGVTWTLIVLASGNLDTHS